MFIGAEFLLNQELNIKEMTRNVAPYYEKYTNFLDLVFEEDKALVAHFFENPIQGMQFRIYFEGELYWMALSIEERGNNYKAIVINIDSLKKNLMKYKTNDRINSIIDEIDSSSRFVYNRDSNTFEKLNLMGVEYSKEKLDEKFVDSFKQIIHKEDISKFESLINDLKNTKNEFSYKMRFLFNDTYSYCKIEGNVVKLKDQPTMVVGVLYNMSHNEKSNNFFNKDSKYDPLTGLLNKDTAIEEIKKSIEEIKKKGDLSNKSLLIIDVDNFKTINETYGNVFGDDILIDVSNMLNEYDKNAIIGRYGGDEFILFVDKLNDETALRVFLKEICERFEMIGEDNNIKLSATIGVSTYPVSGDSYELLFRQADRGLYRGKKKGRNCYVIYSKEKHGDVNVSGESISNFNEVREFYLEREVAKNSFITDIIEKIARSISMESLYEILDLILDRYQLDSIEMIMVENHISKHYATVYANDLEEYHRERVFNPEIEEQYLKLFNEEGEFISKRIYDIVESNEKLGSILHDKFNLRAVIQSRNVISEDTYGIVSFNMNTKRRLWTNEEVEVLTLLGRILGEFFLGKSKIDKLSKKRDLDQLTGISSFYKFSSNLKDMGTNSNYSVICLDVIDFKIINRKKGFRKGDEILKSIARQISKNLTDNESIARISDDRFIMYYKKDNLEERLKKILRNIKLENIKISSLEFTVGVYHISEDNTDIMICVDRANLARRNRGINDNEIMYFDEKDEEREIRLSEFEAGFGKGIKNKEFKVYYQPLYDIEAETCISCEALVRWQKGDELIYPSEFIPLFENNNLIIDLDLYICEQVLSDISEWKKRGIKPVPVGINLSRLHIYEDNFIKKLDKLIAKYQVDPSMLILEITESAYVSKTGRVEQFIRDLRQRGYIVALDDFGSGYTALTTLASVDVDCIKIDMELVRGNDVNRHLVIKTVVSLADALGAHVVTEGVETIEQREAMRNLGVKIVQGFLYSRAIKKEEFELKFLKS